MSGAKRMNEILWQGAHLALVKFPGESRYNSTARETEYHHIRIAIVRKEHADRAYYNQPSPGDFGYDATEACRELVFQGGPGKRFKQDDRERAVKRVMDLDACWRAVVADRQQVECSRRALAARRQSARDNVSNAREALLAQAMLIPKDAQEFAGSDIIVQLLTAAVTYRDAVESAKEQP